MRKNLLALSIAAMVGGLSGVANAQSVVVTDTVGARLISNTDASAVSLGLPALLTRAGAATPLVAADRLAVAADGIGHVLFVPYFTTQGSNATLLNLVNTDNNNGKAVKLRFRGAANSDDLFDITVYLSPGDVWTANIAADGTISRLETSDTSCTLPSAADIKDLGGKFKTNRVRANDPAQTREGYIEILNMADVPVNTAATSLYTAIKHVNGKAPCTQAVMDLQENTLSTVPGSVHTPGARGYSWPTGGLFANWTIVNVSDKASFSGEAVALLAQNTAANRAGAGNLVWSPQTTASVTAGAVGVVGTAGTLTADPLLIGATPVVKPLSYDFPDLSTPYTGDISANTQAANLADSLSSVAVVNEYLTNTSVDFATDWVFSMPSRRYAVGMNYATNSAVFNPAVNKHFSALNVSTNANRPGLLCVDTGSIRAYDREETTRTTFVISPDTAVNLCGEVSVLTFNQLATGYSVLGATIARQNIETKFADGWMRIATPGLKDAAGIDNGLPVIGYAAAKTRGANLGGTWKHRYE